MIVGLDVGKHAALVAAVVPEDREMEEAHLGRSASQPAMVDAPASPRRKTPAMPPPMPAVHTSRRTSATRRTSSWLIVFGGLKALDIVPGWTRAGRSTR